MKDQLNVMTKFSLSPVLEDVIARSTWNPAGRSSARTWGTCRGGAGGRDVLSLQSGKFGLVDSFGGGGGRQELVCELTLRDGRILYDSTGSPADWRPCQGLPDDGDAAGTIQQEVDMAKGIAGLS